MVRCGSYALAFLGLPCAVGFGDICRPALPEEGNCDIGGKDCTGDDITLMPHKMTVSKWDGKNAKTNQFGSINSYAVSGTKVTWQNQLHGPHFRVRERANFEDVPPVYVFGTFVNKVYRFENISKPSLDHKNPVPLTATQKLVAHALAPSTGFVIESKDENDLDVNGMLIAEGQPFIASSMAPKEVYQGGIELIRNGHEKNCSMVFPEESVHSILGHVTNTVDCHKDLGVCFFTVWKFFEDQSKKVNTDQDCLWYCIMAEGSLHSDPKCVKTAILRDEHGDQICHKEGRGAVHGMTVGNTDFWNHQKFDILLVFTGKATIADGESSMWKVNLEMKGTGSTRDVSVLKSEAFATDLFQLYQKQPAGDKHVDVGGDHAWVDDSKKYVWISCFRVGGAGIHMVDYSTGKLLYSLTGIDNYAPGQYTFASGIHGTGTLGKKGSFLALATSSCHSVEVCIPVIPWSWPVPENMWSTGTFFLIDLASMNQDMLNSTAPAAVAAEVKSEILV